MQQFDVRGFSRKLRFLLGCVSVLLLFNAIFLFIVDDGCWFDRLRFAVSHALGFLFTVDSPNGIVENHDSIGWILCRSFSWLTCVVGWLFIPLVVGQIFETHLEELGAIRRLEGQIRALAISENKTGKTADEWSDHMIQSFLELAKSHGGKTEE